MAIFSEKLLNLISIEIEKMLEEKRNEGEVEFFPGSIFKIAIDRKLKYTVIQIPVKEFLPEEEERKIIYIGKDG